MSILSWTIRMGALVGVVAGASACHASTASDEPDESELVGGRADAPPHPALRNSVRVHAQFYEAENFDAWLADRSTSRKWKPKFELRSGGVLVSPHVVVVADTNHELGYPRADGVEDRKDMDRMGTDAVARDPVEVDIVGEGTVRVKEIRRAGGAYNMAPHVLWLERGVRVPSGADRIDLAAAAPSKGDRLLVSANPDGQSIFWTEVKVADVFPWSLEAEDPDATFWKRLFGREDRVRFEPRDSGMPIFTKEGRLVGLRSRGQFTVIEDGGDDAPADTKFATSLAALVEELEGASR